MAVVELEVPPRSVYVGVVRLAIAALGRSVDLDEDAIEDLKMAVSEACTNAVIAHEGAGLDDHVKIAWNDDANGIGIEVASTGEPSVETAGDRSMSSGSLASRDVLSLALLKSLVDDCTVENLAGGGFITRLRIATG